MSKDPAKNQAQNQGGASHDDQGTPQDDLQKKIKALEEQEKKTNDQAKTDELAVAQQKIEELTNALARALADLKNYQRRTEEERRKWMQMGGIEVLSALLPILDHFDRSSAHLPEALKNDEWAKGIMRIHDDFLKTLEKLGIKKIETVGQKINPLYHAAMMTVPGEKDVIAQEFEAGYVWSDTVIKPAKVSVGDGSKAESIDTKN